MMIEPERALGFATVCFIVAISPGPSWVYVIGATIGQHRRAGMVAVLGNGSGIVCHVLAASLGLSAILHYSAAAYTVARWIGALYLIYLAIRTIRKSETLDAPAARRQRPLRRVYRDGFLVNLLNPKVSLLMLALLPQFLDPDRAPLPVQMALLGSLHVVIASLVLSVLVLTASRAAAAFRTHPSTQRWFRWASGALLFGFGARLIFERAQ